MDEEKDDVKEEAPAEGGSSTNTNVPSAVSSAQLMALLVAQKTEMVNLRSMITKPDDIGEATPAPKARKKSKKSPVQSSDSGSPAQNTRSAT